MVDWKQWLKAALIRAIRTFAEAMIAYIGTGAVVLGDVNWLAALSAGAVFIKMVGVGQLFQRVRRAGVVCVDVGHLVVGAAVDPGVEQSDDDVARHHAGNDQKHADVHLFRMQRLGEQIEAHHGGHHAGGEGQQQADRFAGILAEEAGDHAAKAGSAHACQGGDADDGPEK